MSNHKSFLENWYKRVWTDNDTKAIDELFAPEPCTKGLECHNPIDLESFKGFHAAITNILTDIEISVDQIFENGPWVSAMITIRGFGKGNGKAVEVTSGSFARIEGGKIREGYDHLDFLSFWTQLGYLPEDSLLKGLQGQKIA